ncbi:MAG: bifunctional phosphoglucose/phosphomannose isomerase [Solirubrobacteraceae bacterium]
MTALDEAACSAVDSTGQFAETLDLGVHLEDALWRVDSASIAPVDAHGGLIVAGMGGSSVGGRLASAVLGPELRRPLALAMGYDIPAWIGSETLVLCSSYSGSTEETVATYDAAKAAGAPRLVATTGGPLAERARADGVPVIPLPGGFQPRAAVGYSLVTALEAAALCGAAPSVRDDVAAASALARELAVEWGPAGDEESEPKRLARSLAGSIPVITGAGLTASVAYRWKCQINENAELPAFASKLPEHDHNEIVGWAGAQERLGAVFLEDPEGDERAARRLAVTAEIAADGAAVVERVTARTGSRLERLVSLVLLGDLVSLYLAVLRGIDPVHVTAIDTLKERLRAARA